MTANDKEIELSPEAFHALEKKVKQEIFTSLEAVTKLAWQRRRVGFLGALVNKIRASNLLPENSVTIENQLPAAHLEWVGIESLSRLRGLVGGRFENIKKKWVDAGFPLREHRGDKAKKASVDEAGWSDMASWLLKHGFEARLLPESKEFLFEVRKRD